MDLNQQLLTERNKIAEEEKAISEYERSAKGLLLPRRSLEFQFKYLKGNREAAGRVEQISRMRKKESIEALEKARQARVELDAYKSQLNIFESQSRQSSQRDNLERDAYELANKVINSKSAGAIFALEPSTTKDPYKQDVKQRAREIYYELRKQRTPYRIKKEFEAESEKLGLKPVYVKGEVAGFEDSKTGMSYRAEELPNVLTQYRPKDIPKFEEAGWIKTETKDINTISNYKILNGNGLSTGLSSGFNNRSIDTNNNSSISNLGNSLVVSSYKESKAEEIIRKGRESGKEKGTLNFIKGVGSGLGATAVSTYQSTKRVFTQSPIKTGEEIVTGFYGTGKKIITGEGFPEAGRVLRDEPYYATGRIGGELLLLKGSGSVLKTPSYARKGYIKATKTYVPTENTFAKEIIEGKNTFPLTGSTEESLKRFRAAKEDDFLVGQTSTQFNPKKKDVSKPGARAKAGLEDPGIFITPEREGSPYFLGIKKDIETKYTLNPFKGLLNNPNVVKIKYKNIEQYPRSIINQPGFKGVSDYLKLRQGSGTAFITKRSELGTGNIKPQLYRDTKGKLVKEQGTTEIEAIIYGNIKREPQKGFLNKLSGYNKYTLYEGVPVPIREYKLLTEESKLLKSSSKERSAQKGIRSEIERYGRSSQSSNIRYKKPNYLYGSSRLRSVKSSRNSLSSSKTLSSIKYPKRYSSTGKSTGRSTGYFGRSSGRSIGRSSGYSSRYSSTGKSYASIIIGNVNRSISKSDLQYIFKTKEKIKDKTRRIKKKYIYQPSLAASILRIKSKRKPREIAKGRGYLFGFRPIVK